MASISWCSLFCLFLAVFVAEVGFCSSSKVYVVYMGSKSGDDPDDVLSQNHHMLASVHGGSVEQAQASHLYTYRHGFKGFAAKLTGEQASQIAKMPGVVSVFPNSKRKLHTTHSWDFMGLVGEETMEIPGHSTKNQVNVIIGFIDTGIWPESPSFSDADMPPVPARWRGKCQLGEAFNASSCNRALLVLNSEKQGESLSLFEMKASARIIFGSEAFAGYFTPYQSSYCLESSLNGTKARGKVLVCRHAESSSESKIAKSQVVKEAGGVGMVLIDEAYQDVAIPFPIPSAVGTLIVNSKPMSRISRAKTVLGSQPAPRIASFSSKGPNSLTPEILKSGKPIRVDPEGRMANAFDYGSGFVDPTRVLDPGLVYDAHPIDYKAFLCSIGYDEKSLRLVTRDNSTCNQTFTTASSLNYPSITVSNIKDSFSVTRTVTNVGKARSVYKAAVSNPAGINVTVVPKQLIFNRYGQKIRFTVNFKVAAPSKGYAFGFLTWRSADARVTSPLVVRSAPSPMGLMR
ncbi:hypothetical protein POTOM_006933 [Populus tomentosa]|uniref:Uncharacterized protein n=1 Tax=Populus tomentosa TaxID=118781 RepID=A0A8X8AJV4_POPTO|nr:hypothetical protein POTOM_006933 [Populus tomentosa]